jgi:deazaflavin-dependent oxidoreductase (nitroreductase family)
MPVIELHTIGRNSGHPRSVMSTSPVYQPDRVVLVASKGGDHRHPEWYHNLVANPDVQVAVGCQLRSLCGHRAGAIVTARSVRGTVARPISASDAEFL